jgi:hypothetical protein
MSLIPSESYSFPDHFSPVATYWKRAERKKAAAPAIPLVKRVEEESPPVESEKILERDMAALQQGGAEEDSLPSNAKSNGEGMASFAPTNEQTLFFQMLQQMAQSNAVAPASDSLNEQDFAAPETETLASTSGQNIPKEANDGASFSNEQADSFLQALQKMAQSKPVPARPSSPSQNDASTEPMSPPEAAAALPPETVARPILKIVPPRRGRRVAPVSAADAAADPMGTANGHGQPQQLRPKTPAQAVNRIAADLRAKIDNETEQGHQIAERRNERAEATARRPMEPPARFVQSSEECNYDERLPNAILYLAERRRQKLIRFIVAELFAIGWFALSAWISLSKVIPNPNAVSIANGLTIVSAAAVVLIPIVLFAIAPAFARKLH